MRLAANKENGVLIAHFMGELDQHSAASARSELDSLLSDKGITRIEFDLSGVTFMDSSGIGVILGRYRIISERGGTMGISKPQRNVERLLKLSGIYTLCTERSRK